MNIMFFLLDIIILVIFLALPIIFIVSVLAKLAVKLDKNKKK